MPTLRIHSHLACNLHGVAAQARQLEALGFDGAMTAELEHDPFLPLAIAAEHTRRLSLTTGIAVAFARNPMTLAMQAHDLNAFSQGRFALGLGSQIQAHITRRFGMPWSQPAARMREMISAIRAIYGDWYHNEKLNFSGEFYTHKLMTPRFRPRDTQFGSPPVLLAAVGPLMTRVAGEVADGVLLHSFSNENYIREHTLPALQAGLAAAGRVRGKLRIFFGPFIVCGANDEMFEKARSQVLQRIAFYASTPAYRAVLDMHGWGELQPRLQALTRENRWQEMAALITTPMLEAFAVVGSPDQVARQIVERYGDFLDDLMLASDVIPVETLAEIATLVRAKISVATTAIR